MNVPAISQHSAPWAGQRLGTGVYDAAGRLINTSIGGYGCAITCLTMKNRLYDPGSNLAVNNIDDMLTNEGGYVGYGPDKKFRRSPAMGCNMLDWAAIQRILPNCAHVGVGYYANVHADLGRIRASIDAGNPVTLEVRWKGVKSAMHFVEAIGHNGDKGDILVNDPETGAPQWFSSKLFGTGDAKVDIINAHFFSDAIPNTPPPVVAPAPAPAAPTNPEPGKGSGPAPAPVEPPKEDEVTQAQLDSAIDQTKQLYEGKLLEQAKEYERQLGDLNSTITQLQTELAKWAPEYVRSWADGPVQDVLTNEALDLVDFAGKEAPLREQANTIVTIRGQFFVDGKPYYRTKTSVDGGYYRGVPAEHVTLYQPPATTTPPLDLRPQLNASQQLHAVIADSWLGRLISKIFGGSK